MSHFSAGETRRHIDFAQSEALHDRMLEEYCAQISHGREMAVRTDAKRAGLRNLRRAMARLMRGR